MSSLRSFFKDTIIYGMASILPRMINIGLVAIHTSVFGTVDYSIQTRWYVYATFINVILTLGLETAFFRFYTSEKAKEKVLSTSFMMLASTSFIFLLLGIIFSPLATPFFNFDSPQFLLLLVMITAFDTLVVIPFAYLRVNHMPIKFMVLKIANVLFLVVLNVFLLIVLPKLSTHHYPILESIGITSGFAPKVIYIMLANLGASIFTLCCVFPEIWKIKWSFDQDIMQKLLKYGLPIMVGGIAYAINENMDKLLIPALISEGANGIYAACYKLGVFMTLYITAFRMGAEPFFFNQAGQADAPYKYSKIMTWFVIFGCVFMVGVVGFLDILAPLLIKKPEFLQGLMIVPIILLANLFSGIYTNLAIWYKLTDRTKMGMYISLIGSVVTIVSLFVFIPRYGLIGAAIATLITYFLMALFSYLLGKKYYPIPYEVNKISFFILLSTFFCGMSYLYFRENYWVSVFLIVLLVGTVIAVEKPKVLL